MKSELIISKIKENKNKIKEQMKYLNNILKALPNKIFNRYSFKIRIEMINLIINFKIKNKRTQQVIRKKILTSPKNLKLLIILLLIKTIILL